MSEIRQQSESREISKNVMKIGIFLLAACGLAGCAIPGFELMPKTDDGNKNHILGYMPVKENPTAEYDDAATKSVIPISADLVRYQQSLPSRRLPANVAALFGLPRPYTIGPGDVVGVIVYDHPELLPNAGAVINQQTDPTGINVAPGFIVSSSGEISFPYVGRVKLQGLTEIDASDLISQRIAKYIKEPQVTVRIQSFRSRRAYVEGEVRTPGMQIFTDVPMNLAEAINRAGGITTSGDRSFITLTRAGQTTRIDLQLLQESGNDAAAIPLLSGDIVNVRSREDSKIFVMGEIARPSALMMRNGRMSLNEALGEAGGPNLTTANTAQVYVIRNDEVGNPLVYHLNAKNPTSLALAERFALAPKDVVYVDPVGLVLWSRIISLILPSAQVVNLGSDAAKK